MKQWKPQLFRYGLAMNASALDAAAHACAAFFGVAGVHAAAECVPALSLTQLGAVFALSFARGILAYLEAHPLEELPALTLTPAGVTQTATSGGQANNQPGGK